jgi:UDP-N-acetylmuramoyl-L-alanyl-D-glutamate--2,6-diaminopimelate ligase
MELKTLLAGHLVSNDAEDTLEVSGLARDSRAVKPGDLFFAVPGTRVDGSKFARDAVSRGAVAVVSRGPIPGLTVPVLQVDDVALALGVAADRLHGEPSREVMVTGVTGTNGKTTTTYLLSWILEAAGLDTSLLGTISTRVAGRERAATMTTPCVLETHAALAEAKAAGERNLVMEVSSHALDQNRVAGVRFKCAVFTNLTRDHLDYHGTLEAYGRAKARLFTQLEADGVAVLNARDPYSSRLARETRGRVVRYAWSVPEDPAPPAEVEARIVEETLFGTTLDLYLGRGAKRITIPQIGRFNIENALAAAAAAHALGVAPSVISAALEANQGVPGRFERVTPYGVGPAVLVDYAHTPDALERVLETLRPLVQGRLWVVFGCGGERDRGKRGPMGQAVLAHADEAILTSDNPRGEDPAQIADDVIQGAGPQSSRLQVELDRRSAIRKAILSASAEDLVLIAGKGHEQTQTIGSRVIPCDDREIARASFYERSGPQRRIVA